MKIGTWGFSLASLALLWGMWLMRPATLPSGERDEERFTRLERELTRTRAELAQLRGEAVKLRLAAASAPPDRAELSDAVGEELQEAAIDDVEARGPEREQDATEADPERSEVAYHAFIAGEFDREPSDSGWAAAHELRGKLSSVLPVGSRVRSFDCRTSICRIETSHHDLDTYQSFAQGFSFLGGDKRVWHGSGFFHITHAPERPGDELVAVAFLGRDALPSAKPPR